MTENADNLSAVLYGINDIRLEPKPIPEPKDDEVLLKMEVVGICGSDLHLFSHGRIAGRFLDEPITIGHEGSGTVMKVGHNVQHLKLGDRVAIEPSNSCKNCCYCREGRSNLCLNLTFCSAAPTNGILSRYLVHPAECCFKLPDHMSLEEGLMLEPLSIGIYACRRANVCVGDTVLILGAGPIGLVTMLAAKAFGASKVVITDYIRGRLDKAKELGADSTVVLDEKTSEEATITTIIDSLGCQPHKSIDCAGYEKSIRVAIRVTRAGGVVAIIGFGECDVNVPIVNIINKEIDIRGVLRNVDDIPAALELVSTGTIDVKPLITHHFKMEETMAAFQTAEKREGNTLKVLIHVNPDWRP